MGPVSIKSTTSGCGPESINACHLTLGAVYG